MAHKGSNHRGIICRGATRAAVDRAAQAIARATVDRAAQAIVRAAAHTITHTIICKTQTAARALAALLLPPLLAACANYKFTVNEQVVYTPPPLFTGYEVEDRALAQCVKQIVREQHVTAPEQLLDIHCENLGIASLSGLEPFTGVTRVNLSNNMVRQLGPLSEMTGMLELELEGNQVRSLLPLRGMTQLSYLGLRGNATLNCAELRHFRAIAGLQIQVPEHC